MVPVVMDAMRGAIILHVPVLPETGLCPERAARFRKDRDMTRSVPAEAMSDWKSEASNQRVESEQRADGRVTGPRRETGTGPVRPSAGAMPGPESGPSARKQGFSGRH